MGRVVCLSFPLATGPNEVERVRAIHPAIEVVAAPYIEDEGRGSRVISCRATHCAPRTAAHRGNAPRLRARRSGARARCSRRLADFAKNLRWCTSSAPEPTISRGRLGEHNVVVTNSSGVAARSIAEYVVGRC